MERHLPYKTKHEIQFPTQYYICCRGEKYLIGKHLTSPFQYSLVRTVLAYTTIETVVLD
jgi:hypothetical protein